MVRVDVRAPLRFLDAGYKPDDWVAVFLKSYTTGETAQRVGPLSWVTSPRFQAWLRSRNAARWNIYVSVNALTPTKRSRTRDAVRTVRHVFLEADQDAPLLLTAIAARPDLPSPSYVLHSSPNRAHVFWRVTDFTVDVAEALQKQLARELHTDRAATPCTQTTRLPGFFYLKSPVVRTRRIALIYLGLIYEAVTDMMQRARRRPEPTASSFSPGASCLWCCSKAQGGDASLQRLITVATGIGGGCDQLDVMEERRCPHEHVLVFRGYPSGAPVRGTHAAEESGLFGHRGAIRGAWDWREHGDV
jgi:hypothetical protein